MTTSKPLRGIADCGMISFLSWGTAEMKFIAAAISLVGLIGPAICQTSTPPAAGAAGIAEQVPISSFQWQRREDDNGIASFKISNNTDKAIDSIELICWVGEDRTGGTKVMVWPSPGPILAHEVRQFSRVNIGPVGSSPSVACEVADAN
ncbi:hypothetical protein KMZ68_14195 [Bradyrhizobium sediminis]|uniref:Uncharacterized protein n=1 Tax=Bradyrhizobium sediminis TaxID=2840469 RepID=A0A975NJE8_9BRAD|nr:hypothetical protein [Bradyrhizobium sediminis]QWG16192.1 hypothetical protein KMZ68_14195 [Bradyrhizobium sediminis]